MTLLEFARGPALHWSLVILVVGLLWRLLGTLLVARGRDLSVPKGHSTWIDALRTVANRSIMPAEFRHHARMQIVLGYLFHIGLFIVIFLFVPHIEFIRGAIGLSWPGLPNDVVMISAVVAVVALATLLAKRLTSPVLRTISTADDYITWALTVLPFLTGLAAYAHLGARYETLLAIHLLSVELLMIWFPFGKLMHAILFFPSRAEIGATYGRRGVRI